MELSEDYCIEIAREVERSAIGNKALAENFPFALVEIIVLLVLQFNSFRRPAINMLTIPLVVIGAVLGIYSLVGIIVNNGIMLIDRIDVERTAGIGVQDAITETYIARMRALLMTTLTTILGLITLALFGALCGFLWLSSSWEGSLSERFWLWVLPPCYTVWCFPLMLRKS